MRINLILAIFVLLISACKTGKSLTDKSEIQSTPKNIILLIGDGMGMGQISAGTYANDNYSALERMPVIGLHKPTCYDSLITDSAAAATAFACGQKTYYAAIGVDKDTMPLKTILEEAEDRGLVTGLVATSTIVHATPASFAAHDEYRRNYEAIAEDFVDADVEYLVGGGKKYFDRREKDDRNLLDEMRAKGYLIGDYLTDFSDFRPQIQNNSKVFFLTADKDPLPYLQGRDYLQDASMAGIRHLDQMGDKGFFMMIEGSQIDWGGHANNTEWIISEFTEFSNVIGQVLDWAKKDGETLVIVTADHETGGYTIQPGSTIDELKTAFTSKKHSGDFIPVFAFGPGSEYFAGIYENTEIYHKMRKALGWD